VSEKPKEAIEMLAEYLRPPLIVLTAADMTLIREACLEMFPKIASARPRRPYER
jgi:hypothetical protein